MWRHEGVRHRQCGGHGHSIKQQRPLGFLGQTPHQGYKNDETHFKEDGQTDQKRRHQNRPCSLIAAKSFKEPVRQRPTAARVF
jgi:hypothetical protein